MKTRAPRNRTLTCLADEIGALSKDLTCIDSAVTSCDVENKIIHQDIFDTAFHLPKNFVDPLILDPSYNLSKKYDGDQVEVSDVLFQPIEFLSWNCLMISEPGWGKIQISDSNRIAVSHGYSRKEWILTLCESMFEFYPREIHKIEERIERFRNMKTFWDQKQDIWA